MIRLFTAIGALSTVAVSACAAGEKGTDMTAETLKASLDQALPAGSAPDQVIRHLDASGFEHSGYVPAERRIDAIRRDPDQAKAVARSLSMRFDFGSDDRLQGIAVREVFTGP